jgi:hypothetical protein
MRPRVIHRRSLTPAFSRMSSISFDACAFVRFSSKASLCACSHKVFRYEAWAPVIGSSPDTQSSGSFSVLPAELALSFAILQLNLWRSGTMGKDKSMSYWTAEKLDDKAKADAENDSYNPSHGCFLAHTALEPRLATDTMRHSSTTAEKTTKHQRGRPSWRPLSFRRIWWRQ